MLLIINSLASAQTQEKIPWPSMADSPWPIWRADAQATGRSEYVGPRTNNVVYRTDMPYGILFGPVIGYDDILYMGTRANSMDSNYFYAVKPDGTLLWDFRTEGPYPNEGAGIVGSDTTIYISSNNTYIYALDKHGNQKWKIGKLAVSKYPLLSMAKNGDLYVSTHADSLLVIDTKTGEIKNKIYLGVDGAGIPVSFTTDGENIVYVKGTATNFDNYMYLVFADLDGNEIWSRAFFSLVEYKPTLDNENNIYVVGTDTANTPTDKLFSFDNEGNLRWEFITEGLSHKGPPTIDSDGNIIFLAGKYYNDDLRYAIYSVDYKGNENWSYLIDPDLPRFSTYVDHPLTVDAEGKIYFGASRSTVSNGYFYCLNKTGELLWKLDLEGRDYHANPVIGSDGTLYLTTHQVLSTNVTRNLIAIKDKPNSVEDDKTPTEFTLHQNYPNPFNPTTSIEYQVASNEKVNLKVCDILGREVAVLVNETKQPGSYEVEFDGSKLSSGIYFYVLEAENVRVSKKMMLIK